MSDDAINERIKASMDILGVNSRRKAARILALHEGGHYPQSVVPQPLGIEAPDPSAIIDPSFDERGRDEGSARLAVREEHAPYSAQTIRPAQRSTRLPIRKAGEKNDLNVKERMGWAVIIAALSVITIGALLSIFAALAQLSRAVP